MLFKLILQYEKLDINSWEPVTSEYIDEYITNLYSLALDELINVSTPIRNISVTIRAGGNL